MPELPSVVLYIECLTPRIVGERLERVRLATPFLLRSVDPPISDAEGRVVESLRRLGKRIAIGLQDDLFLVIHLMIAGRFRWREHGAKVPGRIGLAAFDFTSGSLMLTEASKKKRASLHLVRGEEGLEEHDRGGLEVLEASFEDFDEALRLEHHTLKRALTDPRLFSGIGNAYSDEILHRARLSPFKLTQSLPQEESERLFEATVDILNEWVARLRKEVGDGFPKKVTAFHPEMAVHGKYKQPCPACAAPIQRVVYAENEANYCAECQTGGRLLADRALSRLLKKDWPRSLEELEALKAGARRKARGRTR